MSARLATTTTPNPALASQRLPHTSLIATTLGQLSENEAYAALLRKSVQGYRWDLCEPQGALMATNLAPLQNSLTVSANGIECQKAS